MPGKDLFAARGVPVRRRGGPGAIRLAAWGAAAFTGAAGARAADNYLYFFDGAAQQGGQPAYWDLAGQPYGAWYDQTTGTFPGTPSPPGGTTVELLTTGGLGVANLSLTFNHSYGAGTSGLNALLIDSGNSLVQNDAGTLMSVTGMPVPFAPPSAVWGEIIGVDGSGSYVQSAGTNSVTSHLILGQNATGFGSYTLSGGQLVTNAVIGGSGRATFLQTGTSLNTASNVTLGVSPGSSGTYTLGGGTLTVNGPLVIGAQGGGTFLAQGGTLSVGANAPVDPAVSLGDLAGGSGEWDVSGSAAATVYGPVYVGRAGRGTLSIDSGTFNILKNTASHGPIYVGFAAGSSGTMSLGGTGSVSLDDAPILVGYQGAGTYVQTGGSNRYSDLLALGCTSTGVGSANLSGGLLSVNTLCVGSNGAGTFLQSGGTHNAWTSYLGHAANGSNPAGTGTYTLQGGNFTVATDEYVGYAGLGTLTQSGGTHTIATNSGSLYIGFATAATGTINLSGGTLNAQTYSYVGYYGTGSVVQTGGTHNAFTMYIGSQAGSHGSYTLSGAESSLQLPYSSSAEYVGDAGDGTFNQSGGTHTIGGVLVLGNQTASSGTFTLSGGKLTVSKSVTLGASGAATFNQLGGSLTAGSNLTLAANPSSVASYSLSNGATLSVAASETIGAAGRATFLQYGGTHTVGGTLGLSSASTMQLFASPGGTLLNAASMSVTGGSTVYNSGGTIVIAASGADPSLTIGSGTYRQDDGELDAHGALGIGGSGDGTLRLNGGTVTVGPTVTYDHMTVGSAGGSHVYITAGTLNSDNIYLGSQSGGAATWDQSGGSVQGLLFAVGDVASSSGTATVSGGSLTAKSANYVGQYGNGTFNQSGGTVTTGTVILGYGSYALYHETGVYNLSGGTLSVTSTERVGQGGSGTMNQSGGVHTVRETLAIGTSTNGAGTLNLSAGSLTAHAMLNYGSFNQSGGNAALGAVTGSGTISLSASAGPALMTVTSFNQWGVVIGGGTLRVNPAPTAVTNNAAGLAVYGTGVLDLNNQSLLTASPAANVEGMLENGYNGGAWNGTAGGSIVSTSASLTDPAARWTLGYATGGADVSAVAIPSGQTLVKYTIPGDADLSGSVDFNDFLSLQNGYERPGGDWARGDFNYDGVVDYSDYLILKANFGRTPTGVNASVGALPDIAPPAPEPAALGLLGASAAAGLLARRRRPRGPGASR